MLNRDDVERFSRQLIVAGWSAALQERIMATSIAIPEQCSWMQLYAHSLGFLTTLGDDADILVQWEQPSGPLAVLPAPKSRILRTRNKGITQISLHSSELDEELRFSAPSSAEFSDAQSEIAAVLLVTRYLRSFFE